MNTEDPHITEYSTYAKVLVVLLLLTALTIGVTHFELKAWSVGVALLIACTMAFVILTYFMHLKFDHILLKILVGLVFVLFAIFIGITLLEYATR
jgi:cytochrome c oxidase subunit IV